MRLRLSALGNSPAVVPPLRLSISREGGLLAYYAHPPHSRSMDVVCAELRAARDKVELERVLTVMVAQVVLALQKLRSQQPKVRRLCGALVADTAATQALRQPPVLGDACCARVSAARQALVHRNVKLGNLLLCGDGMVRLTGFMRLVEEGARDASCDAAYFPPDYATLLPDGRHAFEDAASLEAANTPLLDVRGLGMALLVGWSGRLPVEVETGSSEAFPVPAHYTAEAWAQEDPEVQQRLRLRQRIARIAAHNWSKACDLLIPNCPPLNSLAKVMLAPQHAAPTLEQLLHHAAIRPVMRGVLATGRSCRKAWQAHIAACNTAMWQVESLLLRVEQQVALAAHEAAAGGQSGGGAAEAGSMSLRDKLQLLHEECSLRARQQRHEEPRQEQEQQQGEAPASPALTPPAPPPVAAPALADAACSPVKGLWKARGRQRGGSTDEGDAAHRHAACSPFSGLPISFDSSSTVSTNGGQGADGRPCSSIGSSDSSNGSTPSAAASAEVEMQRHEAAVAALQAQIGSLQAQLAAAVAASADSTAQLHTKAAELARLQSLLSSSSSSAAAARDSRADVARLRAANANLTKLLNTANERCRQAAAEAREAKAVTQELLAERAAQQAADPVGPGHQRPTVPPAPSSELVAAGAVAVDRGSAQQRPQQPAAAHAPTNAVVQDLLVIGLQAACVGMLPVTVGMLLARLLRRCDGS
jgi:hypothetical protein